MKTFCTISTGSHIKQTLAMVRSTAGYGGAWRFRILVVEPTQDVYEGKEGDVEYRIEGLDTLRQDPLAAELLDKYRKKPDQLRWSLKPVWMDYLLSNGYEEVIYVDNDIVFFADPSFLFEELKNTSILLNPHWRNKEPFIDEDWFLVNFRDGVYNGGFVGASNQGQEALQWWARCCEYACEKDFKRGLFDDQKYLDLMPAAFEDVKILQHRGCNVAYWNADENMRSIANGEVVINNEWPVVFVHFTADLLKQIEKGKEPELQVLWQHHLDNNVNAIEQDV